ncbi:hypothetical protein [Phyllobacterium sp. YR531]|uniref:hypothetical protein n=1 Tax=Phyllobacterium sp. YR531 TaxID=1144343 RepID=UPI001AEC124E|nr:hypothetical protein [Phyllobacterium sp. YR531]
METVHSLRNPLGRLGAETDSKMTFPGTAVKATGFNHDVSLFQDRFSKRLHRNTKQGFVREGVDRACGQSQATPAFD